MFHPVGSRPPSVYWRRRFVLIGSAVLLIALLVLTLRALMSTDSTPTGAGAATTSRATSPDPTPTPSPTSTAAASSASSASSTASSSPVSSSVPPARCLAGDLAVIAVVAQANYKVGDRPVVELQVTNTGARPCVQDLADRQVELKIYNGESRVWGSHDCEVQPGTNDRTLAPGRAVRVSITWSGLTSQPKCAGTRQRVGAGTYTLYASLSGKTGKAAQFAIS